MNDYKKLCKQFENAVSTLINNIDDPNALMAFMYFCHSNLHYLSESNMRKVVNGVVKGKITNKKVDDFWKAFEK